MTVSIALTSIILAIALVELRFFRPPEGST